jgi:hypothetical protein
MTVTPQVHSSNHSSIDSIDRPPAPLAGTPVSSQGRVVLEALSRDASGRLWAVDLLDALRRPGTADAVTRASLSRTLRRLWRLRLVELVDIDGRTLTGEANRMQAVAARVLANPDSAFAAYLDQCRRHGQSDEYGSARRYAARWRTEAQRVPSLRAYLVDVTAAGRQAVNKSLPRIV